MYLSLFPFEIFVNTDIIRIVVFLHFQPFYPIGGGGDAIFYDFISAIIGLIQFSI